MSGVCNGNNMYVVTINGQPALLFTKSSLQLKVAKDLRNAVKTTTLLVDV